MGCLGHSKRRWAQRALPLLPILRARHGQVRADLADRQRLGACNRLPCDRAACDLRRTQHRAHLRDPLSAMAQTLETIESPVTHDQASFRTAAPDEMRLSTTAG